MNREINELREVITKLVPMLAGKGLTVTQRGAQAYVKADPVTKKPIVVNIPNISDNATPDFIRAVQGFVDHEVGHVLITDWNYYGGYPSPTRAQLQDPKVQRFIQLHNILEDTMIEPQMALIFPGTRKNIADLRVHFIAKVTKPHVDAAKTDKESFSYLLVVMMRALAGHIEFAEFMDRDKHWDHPIVKELNDKLPADWKRRLIKASSTKETLQLTIELDKILYPPEPVIDVITPNQGTTAGAETVTITGKHFTGTQVVTFGNERATFKFVSDTELTVTTPAHPAGVVAVQIQNSSGTGNNIGKLDKAFTFIAPPPPPSPPEPEEDEFKNDMSEALDEEQDEEEGEGESEDRPDQKAGEGDGDGERDHSDQEEGEAEDGAEGDQPGEKGDKPEKEDKGDEAEGEDGETGEEEDTDDKSGSDADEKEDGAAADEDGDEDGDDAGKDPGDDAEPDEKTGDGDGDEAEEEPADDGDADGSAGGDGGEPEDDDGDEEEDQDAEGELGENTDGAGDDASDEEDGAGGGSDEETDDEEDGEGGVGKATAAGEEGDDEKDGKKPDPAGGESMRVAIQTDDHDAGEVGVQDEDTDGDGGGVGGGLTKSLFDFSDKEFEKADMSSQVMILITNDAVDSLNDNDYNVFTREYDRIEILKTPESMDPTWVPELEEKTRAMTSRMAKDIERMMAAQSRVVKVPGFRSGRLHAPNLHRLMTGDDRVFNRKEEYKSKDTAVILLDDCSGSMSGKKCEMAMTASYALSTTLERVNIKHEVIGFTTGDYNRSDRTFWDEMNRELADAAARGVKFHRVYPISMPIFKTFDERINADVKKRFAFMSNAQPGMGSNIDGESLEYAAMRLLKRKEKRKVILVLSDGQPAGAENVGPHLKETVKKMGQVGIDCVGIGIMDRAVERYYPKHTVLTDIDQLPGQIMQELRVILQ